MAKNNEVTHKETILQYISVLIKKEKLLDQYFLVQHRSKELLESSLLFAEQIWSHLMNSKNHQLWFEYNFYHSWFSMYILTEICYVSLIPEESK